VDYHGHNKFGHPLVAFQAYVAAHEPEELPAQIEDLIPMGEAMLNYYVEWEKDHCDWKTVYVDGKPLVEVQFSLVLEPLCYYTFEDVTYNPVEQEDGTFLYLSNESGELFTAEELDLYQAERHDIVFHGTLDRVVEDKNGAWWVLDYKTAKAVDTSKLALDPQISKYCWAAEQWLDHEIEGMLYVQCSKNPPKPPKLTTKGLSTDKRQRTTYSLYKQAIVEHYGDVARAPAAVVNMLNDLADVETENGNAFIRYDWVPRNEHAKMETYMNIIAEGKEILNPNLPLYPNPTKDCSWDCPFQDICLAMEEGADWTYYLEDFEKRPETMDDEVRAWEKRLYRAHPELYPEEYKKHCTDGVDSLEEFMAGEYL